MRVLIVGAGPTGLTAAVELARRGVVPAVVDRRDSASALSRAVGITPRSLELLSPSGVAERLIAEGVAMERVHLYDGTEPMLEMRLHSPRAFFPTILSLPQDRTEALMADTLRALGGELRYRVRLESLRQEGGRVTARLKTQNGVQNETHSGSRDGTQNGTGGTGETDDTAIEEDFDAVIGADGIRSTVRREAGIAFPGIDLPQVWSIADVDIDGWRHPDGFTVVRAGPGAVVLTVPMGGGRYRLVASRVDALQTLPLEAAVTRIRRQGTFTISVRHAETYSRGRIHLAGDAAHCHSPVGGRGMNLGIADAVDLAARLLDGGSDGYSARRREGAAAIAITERARRTVTGAGWQRRLLFRGLVATVRGVAPLRRRLGRFIVEF